MKLDFLFLALHFFLLFLVLCKATSNSSDEGSEKFFKDHEEKRVKKMKKVAEKNSLESSDDFENSRRIIEAKFEENQRKLKSDFEESDRRNEKDFEDSARNLINFNENRNREMRDAFDNQGRSNDRWKSDPKQKHKSNPSIKDAGTYPDGYTYPSIFNTICIILLAISVISAIVSLVFTFM